MTAQSLVHPIQSLERIRFSKSNLPFDQLVRLKAVLSPGSPRRCATNVVVYGGHSPAADEFAAAALECMQTGDSLWRAGTDQDTVGKAIWIQPDHQLLSMLNARAVFLPADDRHADLFEDWQDRAAAIFVGFGRLQGAFVGFAENMLRWDMLLPPLPPGGTSMPRPFVSTAVATPVPPNVYIGSALTAHARSEPLDAGGAFTNFRSDFWSEDHKIRSAVEGTAGGDLSVTFVATDPQLLGTWIRFRFRTSAGRILQGVKQLLRDEGDAIRLVAFWAGNQLDLSERPSAEPDKTSGTEQLIFDFEVLPQEPSA